jgi:hypothetical protein
MRLEITLTREQYSALIAHATSRSRTPEVDIVAEWWERRSALLKAAGKKPGPAAPANDDPVKVKIPFVANPRPHEGLRIDADDRRYIIEPKRRTPGRLRILPTDTPEEAIAKCDAIEESGDERGGAVILRDAGRDVRGRPL